MKYGLIPIIINFNYQYVYPGKNKLHVDELLMLAYNIIHYIQTSNTVTQT